MVFNLAPSFLRLNEKLDAWHLNRPGTAATRAESTESLMALDANWKRPLQLHTSNGVHRII